MSIEGQILLKDDCGGYINLAPAYAYGTGMIFLTVHATEATRAQTVVHIDTLMAKLAQLKKESL